MVIEGKTRKEQDRAERTAEPKENGEITVR